VYFPLAYSVEDIDDIYKKISERLDEYCLEIERDVCVGGYWLFPVVEMSVEK
jgi:hypothetical protein